MSCSMCSRVKGRSSNEGFVPTICVKVIGRARFRTGAGIVGASCGWPAERTIELESLGGRPGTLEAIGSDPLLEGGHPGSVGQVMAILTQGFGAVSGIVGRVSLGELPADVLRAVGE